MRVDISYVSNNGRRIAFGGDDESLHYLKHDLRENVWDYKLGVAKSRISSFSRKVVKKKFPVGIAAKDAHEGIEKRNLIAEMGEYDIAHKMPGRLYVGDYYIQCYIVGVDFDEYWMSDRFAEVTLTLVVERCEWTRDVTYQFQPTQAQNGSTKGADFSYDFEHDFMGSLPSKEFELESSFACDFLWRAYGPATNPYIMIGSNTYRVNVSVPEGARLEVNSRDKTITLITKEGISASEYTQRGRGGYGSGSYIFEKISPGQNTVSWDNTYTFDLVLYEARSLPPFEEE